MQVTGDELMPIGPKAGQPMRTLDSAYLVKALGYDSSWAEHRPLFQAELERRQRQRETESNDAWHNTFTAAEGFTPFMVPQAAVVDPVKPAAQNTGVSTAEARAKLRTLQVQLPEALWKRAKVQAVAADVTMSELVAHALAMTYPEVA